MILNLQPRFSNVRRSENYAIITTSQSIDPSEFIEELADVLTKIPRRIISPFCAPEHQVGDMLPLPAEYEGYLTPDVEMNFRVNPIFFRQTPDDMNFEVCFHFSFVNIYYKYYRSYNVTV